MSAETAVCALAHSNRIQPQPIAHGAVPQTYSAEYPSFTTIQRLQTDCDILNPKLFVHFCICKSYCVLVFINLILNRAKKLKHASESAKTRINNTLDYDIPIGR